MTKDEAISRLLVASNSIASVLVGVFRGIPPRFNSLEDARRFIWARFEEGRAYEVYEMYIMWKAAMDVAKEMENGFEDRTPIKRSHTCRKLRVKRPTGIYHFR